MSRSREIQGCIDLILKTSKPLNIMSSADMSIMLHNLSVFDASYQPCKMDRSIEEVRRTLNKMIEDKRVWFDGEEHLYFFIDGFMPQVLDKLAEIRNNQ